jgi:tetratricopeptide (TPR) repeat protein
MRARRHWIAGFALFVVTMILYWPAATFPFVNYDDPLYVSNNPDVLKGLSWSGIPYAVTTLVSGNWHPLTMLSLMADSSAYHLFAGGYHLTNILLHAANVVLLWILIWRMTGLYWPGVLVAALFAVHPLNVESVAWISERKNVLSTFFFLLTLLAYLRYAKNRRPATYILALVLFALGLCAKPMLVTLPFLLLLLDYWPLQRIYPSANSQNSPKNNFFSWLLWEKIPFFVLTAADCVVTFIVQKHTGAVSSLGGVPVTWRLVNVLIAYATYLEKTFWPTHLCVLYAFPQKMPVAPAVVSSILLLIATFAAWHWRWQRRWFAVGWFWFLGTLVPVIGIVQVGAQSWADRYAYIPLIGIFLIIACSLNEWCVARPPSRALIVTACAVFLCFSAALARQQLNYWQNGVALFNRAITINPNNSPAQDFLGTALNGAGRYGEAAEHFAVAARLQPQNAEYQYNLGRALINDGRFAEAEGPLNEALKQNPNDVILRNTLGVALMQTGDPQEAENEFSRAIALQPDYAKSYFNLGKALLNQRQAGPAITNFATALKLEPDWPEALENLAEAYAAGGDLTNAVTAANRALIMAQTNHQTALSQQISGELKTYQTRAGQQPSR